MTEEQNKLAELVALSEKATQGEWRAVLAQKYCHIKAAGIYVADPTPHMPWRNRDDADFIAALVNWFRANHATLRHELVPEGFVQAVPDPLGRTMCTAQATGQWPFNDREPATEAVLEALKSSPCGRLLRQEASLEDALVNANCEPCDCWRAALKGKGASQGDEDAKR